MKPEQIRQILDGMDAEVVKDAAAILLAQGHASDTSAKKKIIDSSDFKNFSQAITYLKRNYKFSELDRFTTEADLVYVDTGDRKVLLTKKDAVKKDSQGSRFSNLDYDSEESYFENAWEPLKKERKKDDRPQPEADPLTALSDTSPVVPPASDSRSAGAGASGVSSSSDGSAASDSKPSDAEPFGSDDSSSGGGRFKNLEL